MAWAVSHWPVLVEVWVRFQAWPCGVCGWQSSIEVGFSQCTLVFLCHLFYSFIHSFSQSFVSHQCCIILTIVSVVILTHFKLLQCQKRGLNDYVQIGGSEGLDTTHLTVADSICGLNSKPGQWIIEIYVCGRRVQFSKLNCTGCCSNHGMAACCRVDIIAAKWLMTPLILHCSFILKTLIKILFVHVMGILVAWWDCSENLQTCLIWSVQQLMKCIQYHVW